MKVEATENYYLELIEKKQLELIRHPDRREECGILKFLEEISSCLLFIFITMVFKEFGCF